MKTENEEDDVVRWKVGYKKNWVVDKADFSVFIFKTYLYHSSLPNSTIFDLRYLDFQVFVSMIWFLNNLKIENERRKN